MGSETTFLLHRFNPPDDNNSNDLVHKVFVHEAPDGLYKVGDPLPILYWIKPLNLQVKKVLSMPFLFSLAHIEDLRDMLSES